MYSNKNKIKEEKMVEDKDLDEFEKQKESEAIIAPQPNFVAEAKDDKPVIETQFSKQLSNVVIY